MLPTLLRIRCKCNTPRSCCAASHVASVTTPSNTKERGGAQRIKIRIITLFWFLPAFLQFSKFNVFTHITFELISIRYNVSHSDENSNCTLCVTTVTVKSGWFPKNRIKNMAQRNHAPNRNSTSYFFAMAQSVFPRSRKSTSTVCMHVYTCTTVLSHLPRTMGCAVPSTLSSLPFWKLICFRNHFWYDTHIHPCTIHFHDLQWVTQ